MKVNEPQRGNGMEFTSSLMLRLALGRETERNNLLVHAWGHTAQWEQSGLTTYVDYS